MKSIRNIYHKTIKLFFFIAFMAIVTFNAQAQTAINQISDEINSINERIQTIYENNRLYCDRFQDIRYYHCTLLFAEIEILMEKIPYMLLLIQMESYITPESRQRVLAYTSHVARVQSRQIQDKIRRYQVLRRSIQIQSFESIVDFVISASQQYLIELQKLNIR